MAVTLCCLFFPSCSHNEEKSEDNRCSVLIKANKSLAAAQARVYVYSSVGHIELRDSAIVDSTGYATISDTCHTWGSIACVTVGGNSCYFIMEPGSVTVDLLNEFVSGPAQNNNLQAFTCSLDSLRNIASIGFDSICAIQSLAYEEKQVMLANLVNDANKKIADLTISAANGSINAFGQYAFWVGIAKNSSLSASEIVKLSEDVPNEIKNFGPTANTIQKCKNSEQTSVGTDFADLSLVSYDGTSIKLSDLINGQDFVIVHAFDPYNETTPHTLSMLHRLLDKSKQSHLRINIVSLCEYSRDDIVKKIVDKFHLTWTMVADPEASAVNTYGIQQLPYFMVIDGKGKIIERGIKEKALTNWVNGEIRQRTESKL